LTGDNADNIKGLYGIGPKKAEKLLAGCDTEESMWEVVVKAYDNDIDRIIENARLLWLRRYENELWEPPQEV
jgi:5'-3' exonuclease